MGCRQIKDCNNIWSNLTDATFIDKTTTRWFVISTPTLQDERLSNIDFDRVMNITKRIYNSALNDKFPIFKRNSLYFNFGNTFMLLRVCIFFLPVCCFFYAYAYMVFVFTQELVLVLFARLYDTRSYG